MGSNSGAISASIVSITGLGVPLAKTAIAGLINISTIAISGDAIVGECATVDAGHSLVAAAIAIAGLSFPLAKSLRRPVLVRGATMAVVGRVGEGAGREGDDEDKLGRH